MRADQQLVVRLLSGRTALVDGVVDVAGLVTRISAIEGVPAEHLRLTACGHELREGGSVSCAAAVFEGAPVAVLLRLEGGKGGFGAMLRTAGTRGIKTTNFDACRDLNGRRLRHVNAEAALREWDTKAEERKLKKQQEQALKTRTGEPPPVARFDDDEYEEMLEGARSRVSDALAAAKSGEAEFDDGSGDAPQPMPATVAGTASKAEGKRKAVASAPVESSAKAAKLWADPLAALEDDSGESDEADSEDGGAAGEGSSAAK